MRKPIPLALAALACPAVAQQAVDDAAVFGAREAVRQISLSPDGKHVAVVAPSAAGKGAQLLVAAVDGGEFKGVLAVTGEREQLSRCDWSAATRLVCRFGLTADLGDGRLRFSRMLALDADGSNVKLLSARGSERALGVAQDGGAIIDWSGGGDGSVLMTRSFVPESETGTNIASTKAGLGVDRVDTTTLRRSPVEQPSGVAVEYITDGHGEVRVRGLRASTSLGYDGSVIDYQYRGPGSRDWRPLGKLTLLAEGGASGFNPYAVDRDLNVAYGFDAQGGRQALFRVKLDGALTRELVYAHPEVDVDGLIRIGRQARVVGVSYATDRRRTEFFDPELKRLRAGLAKALPGAPLIEFVDASADEKRLVLWAGSDIDPGRYYLYDKSTRNLSPLVPVRASLADRKLATVKHVTYPAADETSIPGYLTLPPGGAARGLPAIVMPHGGPGARDEWGFDWLAQFFAARGYAVLQPNFRGSTGYGGAWFQRNGFQSWRTAIGDVNHGGRWLASEGIADPAKLAVLGWSYGGYAALQSAVLDPALFKAIVAVAPVTDLETLRGEARRFTNFKRVDAFIGQGAHVREGSPAQNAERIEVPVLLFHGDQDENVGVGESRLMESRLKRAGKRVNYVEFKELDHQLDDAAARSDLLRKSDAFLKQALKL